MNAIERIRRSWGLMLAAACMLGLSACASVDSTPAPSLAAAGGVAVLPLANFTETPDAGHAAQSIAANALRQLGHAGIVAMASTDSNSASFDASTQPSLDQGLDWARTQHAKYVLTGAVEEWRYKVGVDGEPVVALSFELRELPSGRVVWSATGSRTGWSRSGLGATAQSLIGKLLAPLAAHG
ncbi:penicillin-binding protein activator LpoB [Paraburkholderia silvatlantica]|uniref:TolB-like protein n=1 Tax=Paraburkholderia silvatlantica TaxID=321895 RepID=A0ABR6FL87_9BURK|nr:penicillin-binding protein activator LpoB [Paraburkholderia silvatlantica]MBB2927857.1 TolB-like protein [Paraburkholderia silvatlantica]PVY27578.1 hypothetical protein C7411_119131 [Paraburkholderia silvatlantica]PXW34551.1 hypothetical protein C7413_118131 [Paraburkholderia silvatlantica]